MGMFIILIMVMVSQVYMYVRIYQIVYFKYALFIICQLYINKIVKNQELKQWLQYLYFR